MIDKVRGDRCAAGLHAHWRAQCGYVTGGEVAERHGLLVTATRLPDETLNVAFAPGAVPDPAAAVEWCERWFHARGLRPGIELRVGRQPLLEQELAARGYAVVARRPAMALDPIDVDDPEPGKITVLEGATAEDLVAYRSIQSEVFALAPQVADALLPWRAVGSPFVRFFLARHDDVACATAAASLSEHGAGVVGVATLPGYRRRGIGRAVTTAALRWSAARGARFAWLYPSDVARPLYEGLGFRAVDTTQVWVKTVTDGN